MASAHIIRRQLASGVVRWQVRYRLGGREAKAKHGGSFRTKREAEARLRWIRSELAARRIPDLGRGAPSGRKLRDAGEAWLAGAVDLAPKSRRLYRGWLDSVVEVFGDRDPASITAADVADYAARSTRARSTIRKELSTLAQVLDQAGVAPNPARARSVRLPRAEPREIDPPTAAEVETLARTIPEAYRGLILLLDATGLRITEALSLRWADLDPHGGRLRVSVTAGKGSRARWVPVPEDVLEALGPAGARGEQVFSLKPSSVRTAMTRAQDRAGIRRFGPHQLRHRRASLWLREGDPAQKAAWLGHSIPIFLATYSHVMVDGAEIDRALVHPLSTDGQKG